MTNHSITTTTTTTTPTSVDNSSMLKLFIENILSLSASAPEFAFSKLPNAEVRFSEKASSKESGGVPTNANNTTTTTNNSLNNNGTSATTEFIGFLNALQSIKCVAVKQIESEDKLAYLKRFFLLFFTLFRGPTPRSRLSQKNLPEKTRKVIEFLIFVGCARRGKKEKIYEKNSALFLWLFVKNKG